MKNPLNKRFARDIRTNAGRYLGMFFLMAFATAFTSGFLLAASSIEKTMTASPETYAIEDGRFSCDFEPSEQALDAVEAAGVSITPDPYREVTLDLGTSGDGASGITARVYPLRTKVNKAVYLEGRPPKTAHEIALDRVFMVENHGVSVGDEVMLDGKAFTVCGALAFSDYQALFADNSSFMFDALTFTVAETTPQGYRSLDANAEVYNYSFVFEDQALNEAARADIEEDMIDALADNDASLSLFLDAADNQGIGYALDDVQGDQTMWIVLLFMLVVIMAFVFVVLTGATIEAESSVIGTMLASGWRKRELVAHYMVLPTLVGLLGVGVGLATGVFGLTDPMKNLYYHSYSLPPYHTIWDVRIVVVTAVLPFLLLVGITFFGLVRKMRHTPLQFLRHELASRKRRASLALPDGLRYATRFRLRVLLRNASHFVTLFFGILFASLLLLFGTCMLPVVQNYAKELVKTVPAPHMYVLKTPVELKGTPEEREMYAAALRLVEDRDRYEKNRAAIDAARRLQENTELMDALERLEDRDELLDAAERLEDRQDVVHAVRRLATDPAHATISDMQLAQSMDEQTRADLELFDSLDRQTKDDFELLQDVDDATQADIDLVRGMDRSLLDDVRLASDIDEDAHVVNSRENDAVSVKGAEKYAVASLKIERAFGGKMETITVYGIQPNSAYWTDIPVADNAPIAGKGLIHKTKASVGEAVDARNERAGATYSIRIADTASNKADTNLYLTLDDFNELFGNDSDYFNAYASEQELDFDARYVAQHIQPDDMMKMSDQLEESMGKIMFMIMSMSVPIYLILVYLLTKTVIDRSARSISYIKVFGYRNREVSGLYVRPMTYWVLFSLIASLPIIVGLLELLLYMVFMDYAGNFPIIIPPNRYAALVFVGMVAYAGVAHLHMRRIRNIPLELAMKIQE